MKQQHIPHLPQYHGWLVNCSTLLAIANAGVREWYCEHYDDRLRFYTLKKQILLEHSHVIGYDLQQIVKKCWTCSGSGRWHLNDWHFVDMCRKCDGTGIYSERYYILARYNFAGRIFHCPVGELKPNGETKPTIQGLIEHQPSPLSFDAYRCLSDERYTLQERCCCPAAVQLIKQANWCEPNDVPF